MPYDPAWQELYAREERRLRAAFGSVLLKLEHVGSTSVPGLEAKPIIDILCATVPDADFDSIRARLEKLGYLYTPESRAPARIFRKGPADMGRLRSHHLHLADLDSHYWRRIVAFRDHLRRHPADAEAYTRLKRKLAQRFADDRSNYTLGKHAFVTAIEQRAAISHGPCDTCDEIQAL